MNQKKILIGTSEICNHIFVWGETLRQMGHQVHTVVQKKNKFYPDSAYSERTEPYKNLKLLNDFVQNPLQEFLLNGEHLMKIRSLLTDYDIYIFVFGDSMRLPPILGPQA